jgi:hypothetical protein
MILNYDLDNRLMTGAALATYVYDGNGVRVKAVENGVTTVYIGDYYEWRSDSTTTPATTTEVKYYSAAGQPSGGGKRIAMRTNGKLTWLPGDRLPLAGVLHTIKTPLMKISKIRGNHPYPVLGSGFISLPAIQ